MDKEKLLTKANRIPMRWNGLPSSEFDYRHKQRRNSYFRRDLKKNATPQELSVKTFLESEGIRFEFQRGFLKPFHRIVDFYIGKPHRLIIEVDGGYHTSPEIIRSDMRKDETARGRKMQTLRITNEQVESGAFREMILRQLQ